MILALSLVPNRNQTTNLLITPRGNPMSSKKQIAQSQISSKPPARGQFQRLREQIIASGIPLLTDAEIEQEVIELRGGYQELDSHNNLGSAMKSLNDIQTQLRQIQPFLQQTYKVDQVGIFGSYVRGEQTANSDLDILVEFTPNTRFGLVTFCELENYLSEALNLKVDLVMKAGLKPHIGDRILSEVVYL